MTEDEIAEFRAAVRGFAEAELAPHAEAVDRPGPLPPELYRLLAENGYLGASLPPELGGSGLSQRQVCLVLEEFARVASPFALAVTMTSGPIQHSIARGGNAELRDNLLPANCRGEVVMAFALSEPEAGSDAAALRTCARKADGGWRLDGRKHYITWGAHADYVQVIALTDSEKRARGGMTAFLVERGSPGFSIGRVDVTIGNDEIAELNFDDCFVPDKNVIGEVGQGFSLAMASLDQGRLEVASMCLGAASKALDLSVEHARTRYLFGEPLGNRQAIQWMLADSATELEQCRALVDTAILRMERGERITTLSSMCKLSCSEMVGRVTDRAIQIFGGSGLIRGFGVERLYRETRHFRIGEGASEVHRMIIARSLLGA
jgi:acyl-CoA dehydrogenase